MLRRKPTILWPASNASSMSPTLSRACSSASNTSERSHSHFTGRPSLRAADIVSHHPHFTFRHLEDLVGQHVADAVRIIAVGVQRVAVLAGVVCTDQHARLHVLCVDSGDDVAPLH